MMLRSLYAKLSLVLLGLLALVGGLLVIVSVSSTELYRQEADQKLNRTLAELIVSEKDLMRDHRVNDAAVKNVFSMLMEVNPSIEVYLIDPHGKILSYSAEPGRVKRMDVDLAPVRAFLEGKESYPIVGDDPRSPGGRKIFTAARIPQTGPLEGYLYVILGGESYDTVLQKLEGSYILRLSIWVTAVSLLVAAIAGLALFAYLTRRLRRLAAAMSAYAEGTAFPALDLPDSGRGTADEIGRLTATFRQMAGRIEQQVASLRKADALRRELIAGVSHDLRTPLATLQGYVETLLMRDNALSPEERRQYLEIAIRHCVHLSRLVAGLFDLAKLEARETAVVREPFNISELVQDAVQKYGLAGRERGVLLRTNAGENIPFVFADIALIGRVLDNLVENAIRHTPKGGAVDVDLAAGNDVVAVTVSDTGTGIAADELPHIFDRFYRGGTRRMDEDGHAGLGLAIVKKILELHGSTVDVRSVSGKGAAFAFSLPMYRPSS
jgi:two-component system OmpR family sensor kinase